MVYKPSAYLVSAAVAFVALQMQQSAATSLQYDPYTTCTSYDIGDENFPGRGTEVHDDGTCTVTVPEDPNRPAASAFSIVPVTDKSLLFNTPELPAEPVFTKVGTKVQSEDKSSLDADPDAYVKKQGTTATSPTSVSKYHQYHQPQAGVGFQRRYRHAGGVFWH
ncbi:hypothetical protein PRIC1_010557 [Phytophthora ramorum]